MTLVGKLGNFTLHLNEAHFNQRPQIVRTDRREIRPPGFDIAQRAAKMDCFLSRLNPASLELGWSIMVYLVALGPISEGKLGTSAPALTQAAGEIANGSS